METAAAATPVEDLPPSIVRVNYLKADCYVSRLDLSQAFGPPKTLHSVQLTVRVTDADPAVAKLDGTWIDEDGFHHCVEANNRLLSDLERTNPGLTAVISASAPFVVAR